MYTLSNRDNAEDGEGREKVGRYSLSNEGEKEEGLFEHVNKYESRRGSREKKASRYGDGEHDVDEGLESAEVPGSESVLSSERRALRRVHVGVVEPAPGAGAVHKQPSNNITNDISSHDFERSAVDIEQRRASHLTVLDEQHIGVLDARPHCDMLHNQKSMYNRMHDNEAAGKLSPLLSPRRRHEESGLIFEKGLMDDVVVGYHRGEEAGENGE